MSKVLIVEDESNLASLLEKWFQKNGFSTVATAEGEQALTVAQKESYDIMLLDLGLYDKNGLTVLKELRNRGDQRPVVVMSAFDVTHRELIAAGATDFVPKPFKLKELLVTVQKHLQAAVA